MTLKALNPGNFVGLRYHLTVNENDETGFERMLSQRLC